MFPQWEGRAIQYDVRSYFILFIPEATFKIFIIDINPDVFIEESDQYLYFQFTECEGFNGFSLFIITVSHGSKLQLCRLNVHASNQTLWSMSPPHDSITNRLRLENSSIPKYDGRQWRTFNVIFNSFVHCNEILKSPITHCSAPLWCLLRSRITW